VAQALILKAAEEGEKHGECEMAVTSFHYCTDFNLPTSGTARSCLVARVSEQRVRV
jgi:hypothetical protein